MGRLGRGIRLCLEEPFFPHSWVGRGRSLIAKELWEQNRSRMARSPQLERSLPTQSTCMTPALRADITAGRKAHLVKDRAREVQDPSPAEDSGILQLPLLCSLPCQSQIWGHV